MHILDAQDPFQALTSSFDMPHHQGEALTYLNGNSLGPKLKHVDEAILSQCQQWGEMGVRGHFDGEQPWISFQETMHPMLSKLVGADVKEVCAMGTLTGNLHLLLMSFYRPTLRRYKVLRMAGFPSDSYAIDSQIQQRLQTVRDFSVDDSLLENAVITLYPDEDGYIAMSRITEILQRQGEQIALVFFEAVHYLTGQRFDIRAITALAHQYGSMVGFDLAHGIGNIPLLLHDWDVDFAVWCHYKYVCAGPGAVAGFYIHERYLNDTQFRLSGWWGNTPKTRFEMRTTFEPVLSACGWQLSTPEMFSLVSLHESLRFFGKLDLQAYYRKNNRLTHYLIERLKEHQDHLDIITPQHSEEHGCQISFSFKNLEIKVQLEHLFLAHQIVCDVRPGVVRVAPIGLYNTYEDIDYFISILRYIISGV